MSKIELSTVLDKHPQCYLPRQAELLDISALKCKQFYLFELSVKPALKKSLRTNFFFIHGVLFQPRDECLQIYFVFHFRQQFKNQF